MKKDLLHIRFEAFTSTFKMPCINTGTMISSPAPSYSTVVGIISCCLGRLLEKDETQIAFSYSCFGAGADLEKTQRLKLENGVSKKNPETGIALRQFHTSPVLDVYLDNMNLKRYFIRPVGVPTLGRSQDIAWITCVETIEAESVPSGMIRSTLIPYPCEMIGGRVVRFCDYFRNDDLGYVRTPGKMILYQIVPASSDGIFIERGNLYRINENEVVYLHQLESTE